MHSDLILQNELQLHNQNSGSNDIKLHMEVQHKAKKL